MTHKIVLVLITLPIGIYILIKSPKWFMNWDSKLPSSKSLDLFSESIKEYDHKAWAKSFDNDNKIDDYSMSLIMYAPIVFGVIGFIAHHALKFISNL